VSGQLEHILKKKKTTGGVSWTTVKEREKGKKRLYVSNKNWSRGGGK